MKFGREFKIHLEETLPEWRDKFLCYKPLKKLLKHFHNNNNNININFNVNHAVNLDYSMISNVSNGVDYVGGGPTTINMRLGDFQAWFVGLLNEELEKFNDFYVEKEEDFVIRFQAQEMKWSRGVRVVLYVVVKEIAGRLPTFKKLRTIETYAFEIVFDAPITRVFNR